MRQQGDTTEGVEVVEVLSAEPVKEASVADLAEAVAGLAITRETDGELEPVIGSDEAQLEIADIASQVESEPLHANGRLRDVLECMLFVSTEPLSAKEIADSLQIEHAAVEQAMIDLESRLDESSGLQLMRVAGGFQLCTRPEYADYCAIILQPAKKRLSKAALETLAIVAYRQPCTQPEVEAVRGVSVDGVMKTLVERGLVKEAGRKQTPGRPILYATTPEFLEYFGLNDISELPDIDMLAVEEIKALEAQRELFTRPTDQATQEEETITDEDQQ